jgi:hypothetical protein
VNQPLTAAELARDIDPITLAVVHNSLMMVTSEMDLTQEKRPVLPDQQRIARTASMRRTRAS